MRAMVVDRYGPAETLRPAELDTPVPGPEEVLIRVRATTVTAADYRVRGLNVPAGFRTLTRLAMGLRGPRGRILGKELAGTVEAVGGAVTAFRPGYDVFGMVTGGFGAYAEYVCQPADGMLAPKPAGLSFEEAAAIPFGGHAALFFLRDRADVQPGDRVMIYGASGNVGVMAVQLAKHFGAHVTAVCGPGNVDRVRALGADRVVEYTTDDFTATDVPYDIVVEVVGKTRYDQWTDALADDGRFVMVSGGLPDHLRMLRANAGGRKRFLAGIAPESPDDLRYLAGLVDQGALRPVIDRTYPLEDLPEAHRYAEGGHKRGSVVITV